MKGYDRIIPDYVQEDGRGGWMNTEFPPDSFEKYPRFTGYRTENAECIFYQFPVMMYCLSIEYKGKKYWALDNGRGVSCITDEDFNQISDDYPTANDLIRGFAFPDGKRLLDFAYMSDDEVKINIH